MFHTEGPNPSVLSTALGSTSVTDYRRGVESSTSGFSIHFLRDSVGDVSRKGDNGDSNPPLYFGL